MTEYTGADLFVDALDQYGVPYLFGNPGTTELPVMEALPDGDVEYVLGLHEDVAVGAAAGYAQTRRYHADGEASEAPGDAGGINPAGVANLHVTPGLAHGIGNLYGASMTGAPLVLTAGNHELDFRHEEPILTGDLEALADQFCKFSAEVTSVEALPMLLRRAFRVALTPPTGPVFLALPVDVMMAETDAEPEPLGPIPDAGTGDPRQVAAAADALVEADSPLLVVGDGVARSGTDAVEAAVDLAEASGARVHGEMLACEINFPTDHDQWISFLPPREELGAMLQNTDTIVFAGCSTNTTLLKHEGPLVPADATTVHIADDAWEVGKNEPTDVPVVGDPGRVLDAVAERVGDRLDESTREARVGQVRAMKESMADTIAAMGEDESDDPRASKAEMVDAVRDVGADPFVVDEGVTTKYAMLTRWEFGPQDYLSNKGGGLGYGLPASVGAALAESLRDEPRDVLGHIGDGSYLYYPQSIYTAVRHDLDLTVVVPDNRNYRILKDNTELMFGEDPDREYVGMDFEPHVDIPMNAESHGARGHLVEDPDDITDVVGEALDSPGVDVVDVLVHD
ncbi:thiamine pyrophosphate-binding protein [Halosegnis marinus]|uniref:Thiamine pyrophosphate-binding protein n=1 Tax=Halosegnis marinus TaxID=3034023 RepID=A0ABD5ZS16_9EURY|nr:thiamine pyrophosphate-binding protein [Halosegnis sp. DT85]